MNLENNRYSNQKKTKKTEHQMANCPATNWKHDRDIYLVIFTFTTKPTVN